MLKRFIIICLVNFLIAALMGLALRYSYLLPIGINYRFLTHGHSHVAMLGWVYLALMSFIIHFFIPDKKPIYYQLFYLTEIAVLGMMISFPIQGYAAISISFSTLHIICSYYMVYLIWKHHHIESKVSRNLLKASLIFMLLSTLGIWCLGPAVVLLGTASALYQIAIQFFLHFQFNGWFLVAVLAIFFHINGVHYSNRFKQFYKYLIISVILTMALPIYWFAPHQSLLWINGIGILFQLLAFIVFLKIIKSEQLFSSNKNSKITILIYKFAVVCFALKSIIPLLSLIPEFGKIIYQHHNLVIGFIHLAMLGVISGFILSFIIKTQLVVVNNILKSGILLFILGFIITECLLMVQGLRYYQDFGILSNYYLILCVATSLIPIGLFMVLLNAIRTPKVLIKNSFEPSKY